MQEYKYAHELALNYQNQFCLFPLFILQQVKKCCNFRLEAVFPCLRKS